LAAKNKLNICLPTSEFAPLAKTGGLADVSAALSAYLHDAGHDVRVLMPFYSTLRRDDLVIHAVDFLQDLTVRIGPWDIEYSIDCALLPGTAQPVYLIRCPALYDRDGLYTADNDEHLRFLLLSRAAFEMCQRMGFSPDIMHCQDWHTGMVPLFLRTLYSWDSLFANTRAVMTIHNIGYQGVFGREILNDLSLGEYESQLHQDDLHAGRINFLKTGLIYADLLTTVSPTYAREIQGSQYGMGLDDILRTRDNALVGILNGVDYEEWDPATDTLIPHNYSADDLAGKAACKAELMGELGIAVRKTKPLVGIVSRLASQKGFDLLERTLPHLLSQRDFSLAVLGSGERRYERFFESLRRQLPERVGFYRGFSNKLAHWIEAGSDMFLMPSLYEPCGLNQMYSLKYGTVPVVRETGGLADSVRQINPRNGAGTGVLFRDYDEAGLAWGIGTALDLYQNKPLWRKVVQNGMSMNFSWQQQGEQYVKIFRQLSGR